MSHFPRNLCDESHEELFTRKLIRQMGFSAFIGELVTRAFFAGVYRLLCSTKTLDFRGRKSSKCDTHYFFK